MEDNNEYKAVVKEKRMRDKEDEGENYRKKMFAVEISTSRKVIGHRKPLEKNGELIELDSDENIRACGKKEKEVEKYMAVRTKIQRHL